MQLRNWDKVPLTEGQRAGSGGGEAKLETQVFLRVLVRI